MLGNAGRCEMPAAHPHNCTRAGALCGIYEKTGAGQPGTWTLRLNGGAACKLPLNEWHVVGMRVYNTTTIPATARIDMLVDGIVMASPRCAWRRLRIDITPSAAGATGLAVRARSAPVLSMVTALHAAALGDNRIGGLRIAGFGVLREAEAGSQSAILQSANPQCALCPSATRAAHPPAGCRRIGGLRGRFGMITDTGRELCQLAGGCNAGAPANTFINFLADVELGNSGARMGS